ncbi:hypothetical protein [Streptomyces sviceus]|uniref:hypothetical protein n=1 Tax=Streptomyces sviceus TaxID=285530 RepID=UPI0036E01713
MIAEATVDAYREDEQLTGFFTMIEESLAMPFTTTVLGVEVSVVGVDLAEDGRMVARCAPGPVRQDIGILDLPLPEPAPQGLAVDRGIPLLGPLNWRVARLPG